MLWRTRNRASGSGNPRGPGQAEEAAKYTAGQPAYRKIYNAGRVVGATRGERRGEREGAVTGANAALGGLDDWENGSLYVVTMGPGNGVPTAITARHLMEPGNNYKLCKNDPQKLCESPEQ